MSKLITFLRPVKHFQTFLSYAEHDTGDSEASIRVSFRKVLFDVSECGKGTTMLVAKYARQIGVDTCHLYYLLRIVPVSIRQRLQNEVWVMRQPYPLCFLRVRRLPTLPLVKPILKAGHVEPSFRPMYQVECSLSNCTLGALQILVYNCF